MAAVTSHQSKVEKIARELRSMRMGRTALALEGLAEVMDLSGRVDRFFTLHVASQLEEVHKCLANPEPVEEDEINKRDEVLKEVKAFAASVISEMAPVMPGQRMPGSFSTEFNRFLREESGIKFLGGLLHQ